MQILRFIISTFGQYNQIEATRELLVLLTKHFSGFQPSPHEAKSLDILNNVITTSQRIKLINGETDWSIVINPDRIDIGFARNVPVERDIIVTIDNATNLLRSLCECLDLKFSRLAVNFHIRLQMQDSHLVEEYRQKMSKVSEYFNNTNISDWSSTCNAVEKMIIAGKEEDLNIIQTNKLSSQYTISGKLDHVLVNIDINTHQNNAKTRFSYPDFKEFSNYTKDIINDMIDALEY